MPLNFPQVELTYDQKMALKGTDGPPSDTNPYVTNGDIRLDLVTVTTNGIMSYLDKIKLNGIEENATYTPLTLTAPEDITKSSSAVGASVYAARSDHKHDVYTGTPLAIGTSNVEGNAASLARSDHVHDHGSQSNGAHHAVVTDSVNGFMSSAMKIKLDGVAVGATNTPLTNTVPMNVTKDNASAGTSDEAARQDHKHDISTAAPAPNAVQIGNVAAEGTSSSLARADHIHAVPVGSVSSVGTTNSNGTEATFARSDHVHAGLMRTANDYTVFSQKLQPVGSDMLLLEDSEAFGEKKYSSIGAILSAGTTGSLTTAAYSSYNVPVNPGSTYVIYYRWTTQSVPAGTYRFSWSYEYSSSSTSTSFDGRILIDGTAYQQLQVTPRQATDRLANSGFKYLTFTGADSPHEMRLEIRRIGNATVTCNRVDFEFWRINV